ncbi:MAG: hypothetical protein B1H04_04765 [Planctomycetales bacterium 4484_123]|nr:MAG: hypothetical protein B1H04_04765 [Planctomycetales bacterium 4484_123]
MNRPGWAAAMIINPQVPLHRLILSLSKALDCADAEVVDHQLRTAYVATALARQMDFTKEELLHVFHAAALHDIGMMQAEERLQAMRHRDRQAEYATGQRHLARIRDNPPVPVVQPVG